MKMFKSVMALCAAALLSGGLALNAFAEEAKPAAPPAEAGKKVEQAGKDAKMAGEKAVGEGRAMGRRAGEGAGRFGGGGLNAFWENEELAGKLKLTPEQTAKLKKSYDEAKPKLDAVNKKAKDIQEQMQAAKAKGTTPDDPAAAKLKEEMMATGKERMEILKAHRELVTATLTEEQNKTLKESMGGDRRWAERGEKGERGEKEEKGEKHEKGERGEKEEKSEKEAPAPKKAP